MFGEFTNHHELDYERGANWDLSSADYARFRDIYPDYLFQKLWGAGIALSGHTVVDLGTGTGVLPRGLAKKGARFIGIDASRGQIEEAENLTKEDPSFYWMESRAEHSGLDNSIADAVTAAQCYSYFDQDTIYREIKRILKPGGLFAKISMIWLPFEDNIAAKTEDLVLKYNPFWTGAGLKRFSDTLQESFQQDFDTLLIDYSDHYIPFTRNTWRGRVRACRGMGASEISNQLKFAFDRDLVLMLEKETLPSFRVKHELAIEIYRLRS